MRRKQIWEYFASKDIKIDDKNKNASRYSRCPDAARTIRDKDSNEVVAHTQQQLLATNFGAKSWSDWEESQNDSRRELTGGSLLDFANMKVDDSKTLLGDRYLCVGGGCFIVAPSGQGKSSLAAQLAAEWAVGGNPFGIKAARPLKVVIVQGEDDEGDLSEMSQWILNAGFSKEKLAMINHNTHTETVNDVVGEKFIAVLDSICRQFKPDIVIINPYTSILVRM